MEASPNQNTDPIRVPLRERERLVLHNIDATLSEYDEYIALDHQLAVEGMANEVAKLRHEQNGD